MRALDFLSPNFINAYVKLFTIHADAVIDDYQYGKKNKQKPIIIGEGVRESEKWAAFAKQEELLLKQLGDSWDRLETYYTAWERHQERRHREEISEKVRQVRAQYKAKLNPKKIVKKRRKKRK